MAAEEEEEEAAVAARGEEEQAESPDSGRELSSDSGEGRIAAGGENQDRGSEEPGEAAEPSAELAMRPLPKSWQSGCREPSGAAGCTAKGCRGCRVDTLEMDTAGRPGGACVQSLELTDSSDHPAVVLACRRLSGMQQGQDCCSVSVAFSGLVTQESCYHFTCELLKHVLYQRQQLPLPFDQLIYFCRRPCQQQADDLFKKKMRCTELAANKKCQRVVAELEELFGHLEALFTLTLVPRVLLLLGGSAVCPRELYEVNMEGIKVGNGGQSLKTSSCLRKIFRSLFLADVFSDLKSPAIMGAVLLVEGHRNCGIDWFRPKLAFKVPSHGRKLTINLSCCDTALDCAPQESVASTLQDYVWFQAPITLKGFHE